MTNYFKIQAMYIKQKIEDLVTQPVLTPAEEYNAGINLQGEV